MSIRAMTAAAMVSIQRERQLPFRGQVLVELGERVLPEDIVAEASIPSQLLVLDVANALGLEPEKAEACLVRDVHERLERGDVIAQYDAVVTRLVRMPVDGQLVAYDQGCVYLSTDIVTTRLQAGMIGKVEAVTPGFGVVIRAVGSLLQGVWGNGQVGSGVLRVLPEEPGAVQDATVGEGAAEGQILAVGSCCEQENLDAIIQRGVTGLILGSLCPELVPFVEKLPFPVIVLQGFGALPVDTIRFQLLESRSGSTASINASGGDPFSCAPPEVIIPQSQGEFEGLPDVQAMAVGQLVQVNSGLHHGKTGIVKDLPDKPIHFESGLVLSSAIVHLVSDDQLITVPRSNLVLMG